MVLIGIFGFSGVDFFNKNASESMLNSISEITIASQKYFNDVGYWPDSIENLIDTNYLNIKSNEYLLLSEDGQLNIVIKANDKNNRILKKYFVRHYTDKKTGRIRVPIDKNREKSVRYFFGVCSNLYCPSY